jgi:hypothetical protein
MSPRAKKPLETWRTPEQRTAHAGLVGTWYHCPAHDLLGPDEVLLLGDVVYCGREDCTERLRLAHSAVNDVSDRSWNEPSQAEKAAMRARRLDQIPATAPEAGPPPAPVEVSPEADPATPLDQVDAKPPELVHSKEAPVVARPQTVGDVVRKFIATTKASEITTKDTCIVARAAFHELTPAVVDPRVAVTLSKLVADGELYRIRRGAFRRTSAGLLCSSSVLADQGEKSPKNASNSERTQAQPSPSRDSRNPGKPLVSPNGAGSTVSHFATSNEVEKVEKSSLPESVDEHPNGRVPWSGITDSTAARGAAAEIERRARRGRTDAEKASDELAFLRSEITRLTAQVDELQGTSVPQPVGAVPLTLQLPGVLTRALTQLAATGFYGESAADVAVRMIQGQLCSMLESGGLDRAVRRQDHAA